MKGVLKEGDERAAAAAPAYFSIDANLLLYPPSQGHRSDCPAYGKRGFNVSDSCVGAGSIVGGGLCGLPHRGIPDSPAADLRGDLGDLPLSARPLVDCITRRYNSSTGYKRSGGEAARLLFL